MTESPYLSAFLALILVLALMGLLALAMKKLGLNTPVMRASGAKRLKIVESLPLDPRRHLVLLRRDNVEHLVILSANGETVIETGITGHDDAPPPTP